MILSAENYRQILKFELERRIGHNPLYSLKAFSRDINISPSQMSDIFSRKRGLSRIKAEEISHKLKFNQIEKDYFVTMVQAEHERSIANREIAQVRLRKLRGTKLKNLDKDSFKVIHHWYHFAIIELAKTRGFKSNSTFIANKLGIRKEEAEDAIERLINLNMLKIVKGRLRPQERALYKSTTNVPSLSIRNHHRQIIKKASESIDGKDLEERHLFSTTMAIDSSKLEEAKAMISEFHHKLNSFLTTESSKKNEVYTFSSQLFSLLEEEKNENE